jgi:hypothetical protein
MIRMMSRPRRRRGRRCLFLLPLFAGAISPSSLTGQQQRDTDENGLLQALGEGTPIVDLR